MRYSLPSHPYFEVKPLISPSSQGKTSHLTLFSTIEGGMLLSSLSKEGEEEQ